MPSVQRGSVVKLASGYGVRFYDEHGKRQRASGFGAGRDGKAAAVAFLNAKVAEVEAFRRGDGPTRLTERPAVAMLVERFLELHEVDEATTRKLRAQLKHATAAFGTVGPDDLRVIDVEAWRKTLPLGSRHDVFRAFRQVLAWAVAKELATRNASAGIKNPKRKRHERREVFPFESWDEVDAIAEELDPRYRAIPVVLVGTGLRPEELFGLDRVDVDREAGVLHVRRRFTQGVLKEGGKTDGSSRTVPLRQRVLDALDSVPRRIDTPVLFPAPRGGRIDLERFRHREWAPALRAAGVVHRRVYDCRATFATWAIESGVELLYLARIMGTSVAQIEDTYARWLTRSDEQLRGLLDEYDRVQAAS